VKLKTAMELLGDDHLGPFGWSDEEQRVGLTVSQLERFARRAREEAYEMAANACEDHPWPAKESVVEALSLAAERIRALPTEPTP